MDKSQKIKQVFLKCVNNAASMDETIVDYICGMLEDDSIVQNQEELASMVTPLLMESQCVKDEEEASQLCLTIVDKLGDAGLVSVKPKGKGDLKKLAASINLSKLKDGDDNKSLEWMKPEERITLVDSGQLEALEVKRQKKKEKKQKEEEFKRKQQPYSTTTPASFEITHATGNQSRSRDVKLENFSLSYGKDTLLENCDLTLSYGRRYGLVGRNGTGKTTLLKHFANREIEGIPSHLRILHVEQEVVGDDTTALQCVLACDVERERLLAEEKQLSASLAVEGKSSTEGSIASARIQKVYERLQEIDAHTAEARASSILAGLGFTPEMQGQATKFFSGGWRMRIALGRALFSRPDILLLDEPTNHLDLYSCLWLEDYLQKWPGTILIVSHQREFLNSVATDIINLINRKLEYYKGNYEMFERVKDDRLKQQQRTFESNQRRRNHVQSFIDRFRYNAKRASLVQSRIKALERMDVIEEVSKDPTVILQLPDPEPLTPPILQFRDVSFGFTPDKILFRDLNLGIDMESRVALVGANGVGKSTLMKLMAGEHEASSGTVIRSGKLRFAQFSQHFVDQLDMTLSSIDHFLKTYPNLPIQTVRSHLGSFGLSGDLALRTINTLSGGQKCRLVFAVMAWRKPHIYLLDEPTNHLDIETIDALSKALLSFQGGVLLVSHDERLITLACDQIWYLHDNTVTVFDGDFEQYKKFLLKEMTDKNTIQL